MRKVWYFICAILLMAGSFLAGTQYSHRSAGSNPATGGRRILYYQDPMHPAHKSDKPGITPDCGMEMVPVYTDSGTRSPESDPPDFPPGVVHFNPERQQIIGVRLAAAEKTSGHRDLRTVGRVATDENRIYRLVAGIDGRIEAIHGGAVGSIVRKDELLATFYNREFLTAEQALFYALDAVDRFRQQGMDTPAQIVASSVQIRAAEDSLRILGMGDIQIREISQTRKVTRDIAVSAPVTGLVVARNVSPGLRFDRFSELYRLLDLSRVWILADLFENEGQFFRPGAKARVSIPHQQRTFTAWVSDVAPQFDPNTRTLKVRLETDNPGFTLRPDMFVDVELPVEFPPAITVASDAVLNSGLKKTVFVDRGNGYFEPRAVQTGWRTGDRVQITQGLEPGERIVVSGNFLLDSETRMKSVAAAAVAAVQKDPVCGMDIDLSKAAGKSEHKGKAYSFCSADCKHKFDRNPEQYLGKQQLAQRHD